MFIGIIGETALNLRVYNLHLRQYMITQLGIETKYSAAKLLTNLVYLPTPHFERAQL